MATTFPPMDCGFKDNFAYTALAILYFLIFILAFILNVVAIWVCMRQPSTTTFLVYLKNLVAADLLMTLTLPLKAANKMPSAPLALKAFCCRYSDVIFFLCIYMSIILMSLISLDRFIKIVRPCGTLLGQNLVVGKVLSAFFWMVILTCEVIPTIVLTNQDLTNNTNGSCMEMKSQAGQKLHEGVIQVNNIIFLTCCVLICFCYICIARKVIQSHRKSGSKNDKGMYKTKVRVVLVLMVFLVCFVPYHALRIPYTRLQVTLNSSCTKNILEISKEITLWILAMNLCLDPLIYFFLSKSFRTILLKPGGHEGIEP